MATPKSQKKLTTREKKIISNKIELLTVERLADIWKVNMNKKLDDNEFEQFEMVRKKYKELSGKDLPKHKSKESTSK